MRNMEFVHCYQKVKLLNTESLSQSEGQCLPGMSIMGLNRALLEAQRTAMKRLKELDSFITLQDMLTCTLTSQATVSSIPSATHVEVTEVPRILRLLSSPGISTAPFARAAVI